MGSKKKKQSNNKKEKKPERNNFDKPKYPLLTTRLKRWIVVILMFVLAVIIIFSFLGQAGAGGRFLVESSKKLFGNSAAYFLPVIFILGGFLFLKSQKKRVFAPVGGALFLLIFGISSLF